MNETTRLYELIEAIHHLYYAAHWTPDRPCDAERLWENVRIAAGFSEGKSPKPLKTAEGK